MGKGTFVNAQGVLCCSVCGQPKQRKIKIFDEDMTVTCMCRCEIKEKEQRRQREKVYQREQRRKVCFNNSNMHSWNFENDSEKGSLLSTVMHNYVDSFSDFRKEGRGLLLYGNVGTGKTYYAASIANALVDLGYSVYMTNFAKIANDFQNSFEGRQAYIDSLNGYSLLILDDLGAERKSEFMQELVFNVIDSRYRSGKPFIITTNLNIDELKKPHSLELSRVYDRILERCFPVEVNGKNQRRANIRNDYDEIKKRLGM